MLSNELLILRDDCCNSSSDGGKARERLRYGKARGLVMPKCNLISVGGTHCITNEIVFLAILAADMKQKTIIPVALSSTTPHDAEDHDE